MLIIYSLLYLLRHINQKLPNRLHYTQHPSVELHVDRSVQLVDDAFVSSQPVPKREHL